MIHAYREQYAEIIQHKTAEIFELAVLNEKLNIDDFANKFVNSVVATAFESMDPIYILGRSSNELIASIMDKPPVDIYSAAFASPEYWVGWVLGYAQTSLRKSFKTLIKIFPCSELINYYFPYHEMDIGQIIDVFKEKLSKYSPLKERREAMGLSQDDLSLLSDVPVRTIRAYEQNKLDIKKAQADTVSALAKALRCSIDYLIY
jgi:DNA-binding XRE family transcriptional regulator